VKGIELPINVIIIVVLALIVLLAIVALFFGIWPSGRDTVSIEAAKSNACQILIGMGCEGSTESIPTTGFDVGSDDDTPGGTDNNNLQGLCETYYGIEDGEEEDCKRIVCRCEPLV